MKRVFIALIVASLVLSGCGHPMDIGSKHYPTYGLINESSSRSGQMCYEISVGNVIWSIILIETIIMPIYFVGWSLYNPVRAKKSKDDQCTFDG